MRSRFLLLAIGVASFAAPVPSQALTVWEARTMTLTGAFDVDGQILTVRAETRTRAIASAAFPNVDPYGIGFNPNEVTTTVMICNQNGCERPADRGCIATTSVEITDAGGTLTVTSTKSGCEVELTATASSAGLPRASAGRVESISAATFDGSARIQGATAEGTDGRVVRAISWFVG